MFAGCIAKCEAGDPQGCNGAGVLFEFGERADPLTASSFYGRACDLGRRKACTTAGDAATRLLRDGGGDEDANLRALAIHSYEAGCDARQPERGSWDGYVQRIILGNACAGLLELRASALVRRLDEAGRRRLQALLPALLADVAHSSV